MKKIIDQFKKIPTSTISDAIEEVTGMRGYMDHDVRPLFPTKIVGQAVTVLNRMAKRPSPPIKLMKAIDDAKNGSILVVAFEDAEQNITGWGGLLTFAAIQQNLAGTILNCGVRDTAEIIEKKYPVFSRSIIPTTAAGKYTVVDTQIPVNCGGVMVNPGDIIVADLDGVVVVPKNEAEKVLEAALDMEEKEAAMIADMKETGSIYLTFKKILRI